MDVALRQGNGWIDTGVIGLGLPTRGTSFVCYYN